MESAGVPDKKILSPAHLSLEGNHDNLNKLAVYLMANSAPWRQSNAYLLRNLPDTIHLDANERQILLVMIGDTIFYIVPDDVLDQDEPARIHQKQFF